MTDAVHGLDAVHLFIDLREIHVLTVMIIVAGLLPGFLLEELRALHDIITALQVLALPEIFEDGPDNHALGQPEDHTGSHILKERKQPELTAEFAVITALGFLKLLQIILEGFGISERRTVDAGKHTVLLIAAPVGARDVRDLDAVALDNLDLVLFPEFVEMPDGFFLAHLPACEGQTGLTDTGHLGFDFLKVALGEGSFHIEVIVEPGVNGRSYGHEGLGEQTLHGKGHNVGSRMADNLGTCGSFSENRLDFLSPLRNRSGKVIFFFTNPDGNHGLEFFTAQGCLQRRSNIGPGCNFNILALYADFHAKTPWKTSESKKNGEAKTSP